ncbi:hypothetical protein Tco_0377894 [Tanacetum coccineum]
MDNVLGKLLYAIHTVGAQHPVPQGKRSYPRGKASWAITSGSWSRFCNANSLDDTYFRVDEELLYACKVKPVEGDRLSSRPVLARTLEEVLAAKRVEPTLSPNHNTLALVEGLKAENKKQKYDRISETKMLTPIECTAGLNAGTSAEKQRRTSGLNAASHLVSS